MKREIVGPARADLVARDQQYPQEELPYVDPNPLNERLRQAVYRRGGRPGSGWLYAALHAEYDLSTGLFDVHHHLAAQGSCLAAVDALRTSCRYRSARAIHVTREPLNDVMSALGYTRQPFVPARDRSLKQPPRQRIPEPAHSILLLWLDCWPVQAMELMIGLRVINGRLVAR